MGKSCLRFKSVDDLTLDVLAEAIAAVPVHPDQGGSSLLAQQVNEAKQVLLER